MKLIIYKHPLRQFLFAVQSSRGIFDYAQKNDRLEEVARELANPDIWSDVHRATVLTRERAALESVVGGLNDLCIRVKNAIELTELSVLEDDQSVFNDIVDEIRSMEGLLHKIEHERMFTNELDPSDAFLEIQSGEGGTEAQDWAQMLLRMYLLWSEKRGFKTEIENLSPGDVAGIKSVTISLNGQYAYGWLRTETGVHRLVRLSPFDSNHRRHTSFASVFVTAQVDDHIEIEIDPSDVRTDTYRSSGAGGQHINVTDSAVRLTHIPSGVVVQCQNERSQHQNRDRAWKQLRAKLYERELQKQRDKQQVVENLKSNIGFGSQVRSYILDQSRVKDHRTNIERYDPNHVLDGDLDDFMEASLKAGV